MLGGKFLEKVHQNTCNETEIIVQANFQFSHYKSMETLSCHNNQSINATARKNCHFVEANAMNISAKY